MILVIGGLDYLFVQLSGRKLANIKLPPQKNALISERVFFVVFKRRPLSVCQSDSSTASVNHNLEISYNAGATYEAFPNDEFAAEVGQVLYIRKKAVGTPNANGYIKESEPQTVTVEAEHLGRKTNGGGIIDELKQFDLTLTKTTSAAGVTITPVMNYTLSGIKTEYTWLIDNVNALSYSGVSVSENGIYMNYSDFYKDESYQVNCQVRLWAEDADGNEIASRIISAQVSVKVK